eukprot:m.56331 g.56331  ORF g.56331 m.56331 type:complete len:113 (+) comp11555_c0_seq2:970-1308(+)
MRTHTMFVLVCCVKMFQHRPHFIMSLTLCMACGCAVKSQQGNDMLDRAAMVEPGDYLSCPTCQAQLPPNQEDISKAEDCFCRKCGSRFLTLPDARELYNKISLEYLKDETET